MKNKESKKILSLILTVVMVFTLLPGVTVYAEDSGGLKASGVITAFDALTEGVAAQTVPLGTSMSALTLPDTLGATADGAPDSVPVDEWQSEPEYDGDADGTYIFTAAIPGEYTVEDGVEPPVITVMVGKGASYVTSIIAEDENGSTALYLPEGTAITDADLLKGVSAVDEKGNPVEVTIQYTDGLDRDNPQMRGTYPNPPYVITYAAEHPVTGEIFTATREAYVTAGAVMPLASTVNTIDLNDSDTALSGGAAASGGKYNYDDSTKIITIYSGPVTVTGSTTDRRVIVDGTADVMLDDVNINLTSTNNAAAISLASGADVTIVLKGSTFLISGTDAAGLQVPSGTSLTIDADDENQKISATGGNDGAGIGGGGSGTCGSITINGGTVTATGGITSAGIGGGSETSGGIVTVNGGTVIATGNNGGAGIGSGRRANDQPITGGTITINGGVVEASSIGIGQIIAGSDAGSNITINGGSVKTSSLSAIPTDGNANTVYLGKLSNQPGVTSVSVDEVPFWIDGNHDSDYDLYLYMTGEDHIVDVETGGTVTRYTATWDSASSTFTWDAGTLQPPLDSTSVSLNLSPNPVIYGAGSVTATATVTDSSLGTFSLNVVDFYLGTNPEPFASSPVISGVATAALDISSLNIGDHQIKAIYGGSFGGAVSSGTATLHIVVNAETPNISSQPQNATYNQDGMATPLSVSVSITDGGTLSYQWYENTSSSNAGGSPVGTNSASYTPDTSTVGTLYYYCVVTNTNTSVSGTQTATATSSVAAVTINPLVHVETPSITGQPQGGTVTQNGTITLSVLVSITDGGTLSYQWYENTSNSNTGGSSVGTNSASYTPDTSTVGTLYYYCVVTNTNTDVSITGSTTAATYSNITALTVLAREAAPTLQIDYAAEMLTGFAVSVSYTINGNPVSPDASGKRSIDAAWMGTTVSIVKIGDGTTTGDSTAQQLTIPARPAAPAGLVSINETVAGQNDGKITGTGTAMEYSANSGVSWTDCNATEITGLAPGGYLVRYKVTATSFAGTAVSVTIVSGDAPTYPLTVTAPTFSSVYTGYTRPDAKSITISNSGNSAATISGVTVSGSAFEISGSGTAVASGWSIASWTIQPIAGLSRGTYTGIITVTYDGGATATAQVSFTVNSSGGSGSSSSGGSTIYYTVTFNTNGGSSVSNQSVAKNSTVTKPANPTRDGYTFTGWYTDKELTQAYSFSIRVTSGFTLYAGWQEGSNPDQPAVASTEVQASIGANGHAVYTITDAMVKALIEEAQAQAKSAGKTADGFGIEVNVLFGSTAASLAITIEDKAIDRLCDEGVKLFAIVNPLVNISFDAAAIKEINTQTAGTVTITVTPEEKLSNAAQVVIGSRPVYDITIKDSKGKVVSDLKKGAVTIGIAYTPKTGEKTGSLYAVYVPDSGKPELLTASSYDNGRVIFSRSTFSVYGVGYKTSAPDFTDTAGHWAKDNIDFVASRGLLTGTSGTTFSPDTAITRGMFVTALGRLSGQDVSGYTASSFSDVAAGSYYLAYIEWAVKNKIVSGVGDGKFEPDRAITREEMAVMMQNYANATGYTLPVTREAVTFADNAQISSWAAEAVKTLQQAGIVSGVGDNRFSPKGTATRAEAATILRNFVELVIDPGTARGWVKNDAGRQMYYTWDGRLATGWLTTTSGGKYWFDDNGIMQAGKWVEIGGKWYYFYADGKLAVNTTIDGYEVGADGVRVE